MQGSSELERSFLVDIIGASPYDGSELCKDFWPVEGVILSRDLPGDNRILDSQLRRWFVDRRKQSTSYGRLHLLGYRT